MYYVQCAGSVSGLDLEPGRYTLIDGAWVSIDEPKPDFGFAHHGFAHHGSLTILTPLSQAAKDWIDEHIDPDHLTFGRGIVIECRFAEAILNGLTNDGLTVA
jgi:hypothetical protein